MEDISESEDSSMVVVRPLATKDDAHCSVVTYIRPNLYLLNFFETGPKMKNSFPIQQHKLHQILYIMNNKQNYVINSLNLNSVSQVRFTTETSQSTLDFHRENTIPQSMSLKLPFSAKHNEVQICAEEISVTPVAIAFVNYIRTQSSGLSFQLWISKDNDI